MNGLAGLVAKWRGQAELLRRYAPEVAKAKQDDAEELEQALHDEAEREVTIAQASEISELTEDWLRRLIKDDRLPARRDGGRYWVRVSDLPRKTQKAASAVDELAALRQQKET